MAGQGVALMSRALIGEELRQGTLVCPFGPELKGEPFHLVYPDARRGDPAVEAVREWVVGLLPLLRQLPPQVGIDLRRDARKRVARRRAGALPLEDQ